jgi:hypothetical protein
MSKIEEYHKFCERLADDSMAFGHSGRRLACLVSISWTSFGFNQLDFSGALGKVNSEDMSHDGGKVALSYSAILDPLKIVVKLYLIALKDGSEDYGLKACLSTSAWQDLGLE